MADVALLLCSGVRLLVRHGFDHGTEASRTIALIIELRDRTLLQWRHLNDADHRGSVPGARLHLRRTGLRSRHEARSRNATNAGVSFSVSRSAPLACKARDRSSRQSQTIDRAAFTDPR